MKFASIFFTASAVYLGEFASKIAINERICKVTFI